MYHPIGYITFYTPSPCRLSVQAVRSLFYRVAIAQPGQFYNGVEIQNCSIGYFQPNTSAPSCLACEPGTTTVQEGSESEDDCVGKQWLSLLHIQIDISCTGSVDNQPWAAYNTNAFASCFVLIIEMQLTMYTNQEIKVVVIQIDR